MSDLAVLPILLPLFAAAVSLLLRRWRGAQRGVAVAAAAGLQGIALALLAAVWRDGMVTVQVGDWPAPFGITLVADLFAAAMVNVAAFLGLAVTLYSLAAIGERREAGNYYPIMQLLLAGAVGVFLAGDLFNLYVWFEVTLTASFVLMAMGGEKTELEGTVKYMALNLLSSVFLLTAVGLLYGAAGTLNFADLARLVAAGAVPRPLFITLAMLFLAAFGIKAAIFPLFFWLPASYHTPPPAVSALFAGLLTKVGVYALVRFFTLLVLPEPGFVQPLLLTVAGLTMLTGVLGAVAQNEFRRILSVHIVSQVGYLIMGLGLFSRAALAGAVYFFIHIMLVKANLFLVGGVVQRRHGTLELAGLGGLRDTAPALALIFLLSALSLAGVPPLSGFWGKLSLIKAGLEAGHYVVAATAIGVGLLTLFSMVKIWLKAFWGEGKVPGRADAGEGQALCYLPMLALTVAVVLLGLVAGPVFAYADRAAQQLLDRDIYIRAVLGGGR